jgi:divalent anion:Na+ symporter, DASS family
MAFLPDSVSNKLPPAPRLQEAVRIVAPVLVGIIIWLVPPPAGLPPKGWQILAIFVATTAGIIVAPLPMSVVALLSATIAALCGVIPFSAIVSSTGTDLVWLTLLAFLISRGVIKSGLGTRVALLFLRLLGRRTIGLGYGLALAELILAPAMPSITARAGGVMLPLTRGISEVLGSFPDEATRRRVGRYLILCAFHANIVSASMFLTAMGGNLVAVRLAGEHGVKLTWLSWAIAALVPGLLCLGLVPVVLLGLVRPQIVSTPDAHAMADRELDASGPFSRNELVMAAIFAGLVILWLAGEHFGIGPTFAAAIGVSMMFITGVLTWQDALNEKSAWDTMVWIGLLIMLASKLNEYGTVGWFGKEIGLYLGDFPPPAVFAVVAVVYFYLHYFFASATAQVTALFPVSLSVMTAAGVPPFQAAIALGCLGSLYGCLTQYAIGSAPLMFGAGYVTQREWWKVGIIMSVLYLGVYLTLGPLWWKLLGLA